MKRYKIKSLLKGTVKWGLPVCLFTLLPIACIDMDDSTNAISITIQVSSPEGLEAADMSGHSITLVGTNSYTATTDAEGKAVFEGIVPDVYSVSTSWKMTAEEYARATGATVDNHGYTVSGSLAAQVMQASNTAPIVMATTVTKDQSILIGKVYYQGSKDDNNRNYVYAKYVELYNNSDEPIDVAGLYIATLESTSPTSSYPLQYITDSIVAKQVFRIPTDVPFPVQPGGTVLIANSAVDHTTKGASSEPNLLGADFEAKDQVTRPIHENNPATKGLNIIYSYTTITMMNLAQGGPSSVAIFETDEDVAADWIANNITYAYGRQSGMQFIKIPARCVVDAVDILKYNGETGVDINSKRLFDYLDAGYAFTESKSGYDGRLVVRKTASTTDDGRKILQDTNNSANDFVATDQLAPREYF
ncbi:MAG: DUF4876 domain-containing protein [Prevotella sp.]|nr:DUF4876 domain-containing protein [Prevotella sp.]